MKTIFNHLRLTFPVLILLVISNTTNAQKQWTEIFNQDNITVLYALDECHSKSALFFKIINDNDHQDSLNFMVDIEERGGNHHVSHIYIKEEVKANSTWEMKCPKNMQPGGGVFLLKHTYIDPVVNIITL